MLTSMLICLVLSIILNISTDYKSIITIIINSVEIICILIVGIVGCVAVQNATGIIKMKRI